MIALAQVHKAYGPGAVALDGLSLEVGRGECVLLTGPSGAGKSTLLRLLLCVEPPDRGEVRVAGRDLARLRRGSIPFLRRNLGVVFQDFKLLGDRTALENVAVGLEVLGLPRRDVARRAYAALVAVGLEERAERRPAALSRGEQQRLAIARAVAADPPILLADEPTGTLDPERARDVLDLIAAIHARGTTVLVATHDPSVVAYGLARAWRRVRLVGGRVVAPLSGVGAGALDAAAARVARGGQG